jgi:hypothetical protein
MGEWNAILATLKQNLDLLLRWESENCLSEQLLMRQWYKIKYSILILNFFSECIREVSEIMYGGNMLCSCTKVKIFP